MGALFAVLAFPLSILLLNGVDPQGLVVGGAILYSIFFGLPLVCLMSIAALLGVGRARISVLGLVRFAAIFLVLAGAYTRVLLPMAEIPGFLKLVGPPTFFSFCAYVAGLALRDWRRRDQGARTIA